MLLKLIEKHSKLLNKILKYLVAAILLAVPLYPKFPFIRVPGTFVSIRLEDFLIAMTSFVWIIVVLPNAKTLIKDKINQSIIIYLGVGLISLASAILITKTVLPSIGFLHWLRRVEYLLPFLIGAHVIRFNRANLHFYFKLLLIVVVIAFIYGFGQKSFSWPIIITQNLEYSRGVALRWIPGSHINSTFAGHYDLSTYLVLVLPIVVVALSLLKDLKSRLVLLFVYVIGMWLMVNAASRISIFSFLVSLTLGLFIVKKIKYIPIFIIISVLFINFSSNLLARYWRFFEVAKDRVPISSQVISSVNAQEVLQFPKRRQQPSPTPTPVPVFEDRSTSIRFNVEWPRAIRALTKNPLLGTGYSSITLATDNDYLRLLGEVGIVGFFAFFLMLLRIGNRLLGSFSLVKRFSNIDLAFLAGVIGALFGVLINAVFIDVFEASKFAIVFWFLMGFAIGLIDKKGYEKIG